MTDDLCNLIASALNGGTLCIYDSEKSKRKLATLTFASPAFFRSENRMAAARPIEPAIADDTGTARWYRCCTADGRELLNGPIASQNGKDGAWLSISSTDVQRGADITVEHYTIGVA